LRKGADHELKRQQMAKAKQDSNVVLKQLTAQVDDLGHQVSVLTACIAVMNVPSEKRLAIKTMAAEIEQWRKSVGGHPDYVGKLFELQNRARK
jgi:hypothetical protein